MLIQEQSGGEDNTYKYMESFIKTARHMLGFECSVEDIREKLISDGTTEEEYMRVTPNTLGLWELRAVEETETNAQKGGRVTVKKKKRWNRLVTDALKLAHEKGLVVRKNLILPGWSVQLPNHSTYNSPSDSDMIKYVRGY